MLLNLHLLRAIAALAVVYFHTTSDAGLNLPVNIGSHGVDLFFVISGFVIAYTAARSPDRFLIRRIIRVVPSYWTATIVIFAVSAVAPHLLRTTRADDVQLLCSLLFIPRETSYAGMAPTLVLGWSLNYEMYFYVAFALALAVAPRRAPIVCAVAIGGMALLIDGSGVSHPSLQFYARPLVFEFVFGIAVFYLLTAAEALLSRSERRTSIRWVLLFVAIGAALFMGVEEFHGGFGLPRFLVAGIPASLLVLSAILLERACGVKTTSKAVLLAGEASYVLYLIHPYVIYGVLRTLLARHGQLTWPAAIGLVTALMAMSTVAAIVVHLWFEKPVMMRLRRRLLRPRASSPALPRRLASIPAAGAPLNSRMSVP